MFTSFYVLRLTWLLNGATNECKAAKWLHGFWRNSTMPAFQLTTLGQKVKGQGHRVIKCNYLCIVFYDHSQKMVQYRTRDTFHGRPGMVCMSMWLHDLSSHVSVRPWQKKCRRPNRPPTPSPPKFTHRVKVHTKTDQTVQCKWGV